MPGPGDTLFGVQSLGDDCTTKKKSLKKRSVQQKCTVAVLHFRGGSLMATGISSRVLGMFPMVQSNQVSRFEVLDLMPPNTWVARYCMSAILLAWSVSPLCNSCGPCCLEVLMSSDFLMLEIFDKNAMCSVAFKVQPSEEDRQIAEMELTRLT